MVALGFCGLCVGWLTGLTVSPVTGAVLASVTGVLVTVLGAASSVRRSDPPSISITAIPLAVVLLGLVLGSSLGIVARSRAWFSPEPEELVLQWRGLEPVDVRQRLFDQLYPPRTVDHADQTSPAPSATVLFAANSDECASFRTKRGSDLRAEMLSSVSSPAARAFAQRTSDPAALSAAVSTFLCVR
jgi:hypothetical protein